MEGNNNGCKVKGVEDVNIDIPRLDLRVKTDPVPGQQIIIPGANHLQVDCGNCKQREFHVSVKPLKDGGAEIREIVCVTCNRIYKVDPDKGNIGGYKSHREVK